jgi:F0F1-type ATP synthase assembly protein I
MDRIIGFLLDALAVTAILTLIVLLLAPAIMIIRGLITGD